MRIADNVEMLVIGANGATHPVLVWDDNNLVLIDTCFPLQFDKIKTAVEEAGFTVDKINKIILTHQDIDHIGCVKEVMEVSSNIEIIAHEEEAPYIDGTKTPLKLAALEANYNNLSPEMQEWCNNLKVGFSNRKINIDQTVKDGEKLCICGGIEIIFTPGHTTGHICIYLNESKILVTGDALNIDNGNLAGANPQYTYNMDMARTSIEKLTHYDIDAVVTFHGGIYSRNVKEALKNLI